MPRQPNYLTKPAVIAKSDIARYAAMQGKANSKPVEIDGTTYGEGELRFATFAGARKADGLYHGVHQFEVGEFEDADKADLNTLPSGADVKPVRSYRKSQPVEDNEAT